MLIISPKFVHRHQHNNAFNETFLSKKRMMDKNQSFSFDGQVLDKLGERKKRKKEKLSFPL
jgi:hypothetical protein